MNKKNKTSIWTMAMAIACLAMPPVACSNDDNEVNNVVDNSESLPTRKLYAKGYRLAPTLAETTWYQDSECIAFTEDDIEWFDVNTRELRFRDTDEPFYKKLELLEGVEFRLGDETLFSGSTFVGLVCSQVFDDLVLCRGYIDGEQIVDDHYYLYDCYPLQFINDKIVQENRLHRAAQWETFTKYLESKGKLRK